MSGSALKRCSGSIALLVVCAAPRLALAEESVLLKPKYEPGDTAYVELAVHVQQKMSGSIFDQAPMNPEMRQTLGLLTRIEPGPGEGVVLVGVFDRVQHDVRVVVDHYLFDTDGPGTSDPNNPIAVVMTPLLGRSIRLRLDQHGQATSCEGMKPILKDVEQAASTNPTALQFFTQAKENLTNAEMKFLWGDMRAALYPNREVKVGDTWKRAVRRPVPYVGAVLREYNFTVRRIGTEGGRKVVVVDYQATIRQAPDAEAVPAPGGMGVEYQGGRLTGTAIFDVERGIFVKQIEEVQDRRTTTTPADHEGGPQPLFTMDQTAQTTITVLTAEQRQAQKARPN